MVTETDESGSLKIPIPVLGGNLVARGTAVFILLGIMGTGYTIYEKQKDLIALIIKQNTERALEHTELQHYIEYNSCLNKLAIYMTRTPATLPVDFYNMPPELYQCSPKFLSDKKKE